MVTISVTGGRALVMALAEAGADIIFTTARGAAGPVSWAAEGGPSIVAMQHEQDAGHAAEGWALATGRVGTCMATSGFGATNLVTPVIDAHADSVPVVFLVVGRFGSAGGRGTDAREDLSLGAITQTSTKHSYRVTAAAEIAPTLAEAYHIASTGRAGPVVVEISAAALGENTDFQWPAKVDLPGLARTPRPHPAKLRQAARMLVEARRPVLYVGGGVIRAQATPELRKLAELTGVPVVTTLMARGAFPDSHPQCLGMPGMHGAVAAVGALQKSDLIVALGARFDDRVTGDIASFAPHAKVVHVDIDPAEISKNRRADVPIVGDCREALRGMLSELSEGGDYAEWWRTLDGWRSRYPLGFSEPRHGRLSPQFVIRSIGQVAGPDSCYVTGVGQHQMWAAHFLALERPGTFINSGGLGTMGFAIPAALGARLGRPERKVWAIDGDGCAQMTGRGLATCAAQRIPIKVAVINNGGLGMVAQLQTLQYGGRVHDVALAAGRVPDFAKLAEAYGCLGLRCDRPEDVEPMLREAHAIEDVPVLIDFVVADEELVWPMVAAGTSNDDIRIAGDRAALWD